MSVCLVCVAAPGSTNNITAFKKTRLHRIVENLPPGYCVADDNAYSCSKHLLTPFSAGEKLAPEKDAFNFYLSQLQIRIEMTFGFMTNKWRILQKPLNAKLKNVGTVFL